MTRIHQVNALNTLHRIQIPWRKKKHINIQNQSCLRPSEPRKDSSVHPRPFVKLYIYMTGSQTQEQHWILKIKHPEQTPDHISHQKLHSLLTLGTKIKEKWLNQQNQVNKTGQAKRSASETFPGEYEVVRRTGQNCIATEHDVWMFLVESSSYCARDEVYNVRS